MNKFDVEKFVQELVDMGAKWLIFTIGQNNGYYCSYNSEIEKRVPGRCSKRDLLMEIAQEVKKRDIKLIAYLPAEMGGQEERLKEAFGWELSLDKKEFQERYMPVIREWGERFGDLIDGWWYDGCYNMREKGWVKEPKHDWNNTRFDVKRWFEVSRAGNPKRVVAMCCGANAMRFLGRGLFSQRD